MLDFCSLLLS
jgi:hypothetical protein